MKSRRIIRTILLTILAISIGMLVYDMVFVPRENQEEVRQLKEDFPEEDLGNSSKEGTPAGEESQVSAIDLKSLQEAYPDVKGWLTIPDTKIDYPVLQSSESNPEYYLKRNYKKEWNANGSLFLQWNCEVSAGPNLIIYGHNMNSGEMFGNLDSYRRYSYWQEHKSVFFQDKSGISEYEVMAVFTADTSIFPFQQVVFESGDVSDYLAHAKRLSVFETEVFQTDSANVLTLVTCAYEWETARTVVVAVKK